jgi:hypothetical protein
MSYEPEKIILRTAGGRVAVKVDWSAVKSRMCSNVKFLSEYGTTAHVAVGFGDCAVAVTVDNSNPKTMGEYLSLFVFIGCPWVEFLEDYVKSDSKILPHIAAEK